MKLRRIKFIERIESDRNIQFSIIREKGGGGQFLKDSKDTRLIPKCDIWNDFFEINLKKINKTKFR